MRLLIVFIVICFSAFNLSAQRREKDDYAILELVIKKENAIKLHHQVYNAGLLAATDSIKTFTGAAYGNLMGLDTILKWDESTRAQYLQQISTTPLSTWDKSRVYFCSILDQDIIADVANGKAVDLKKDKTYQILRVSQPLYQGQQSAIVYAEFEMIGVTNNSVAYRKKRNGVYFLKSEKGKWKVQRYVGQLHS